MAKSLGKQGLGLVVKIVRAVDQLFELAFNSADEPRLAVTQGIHRDPAQKVQIRLALLVKKGAALAPLKAKGMRRPKVFI